MARSWRPARHETRARPWSLTIDATLQSLAEAELLQQIDEMDADGGSVVILDPRSGEVLAMANAPAFDPTATRLTRPPSAATARSPIPSSPARR